MVKLLDFPFMMTLKYDDNDDDDDDDDDDDISHRLHNYNIRVDPVRKGSTLVFFASSDEYFAEISRRSVESGGGSELATRSDVDDRPGDAEQQQRHAGQTQRS